MASDIGKIANMATVLERASLDQSCVGYHESLLRSYHIVKKLRWLIEKRVDHEVMLEILELLESDAFQPYAHFEERYKKQFDKVQTEPLAGNQATE